MNLFYQMSPTNWPTNWVWWVWTKSLQILVLLQRKSPMAIKLKLLLQLTRPVLMWKSRHQTFSWWIACQTPIATGWPRLLPRIRDNSSRQFNVKRCCFANLCRLVSSWKGLKTGWTCTLWWLKGQRKRPMRMAYSYSTFTSHQPIPLFPLLFTTLPFARTD